MNHLQGILKALSHANTWVYTKSNTLHLVMQTQLSNKREVKKHVYEKGGRGEKKERRKIKQADRPDSQDYSCTRASYPHAPRTAS